MSMRVLITADAAGTVWQYSLDLARGLARLGIESVIALLGPSPTETQRMHALRVPGLRLVETGLSLDRLSADERSLALAGATISKLARDCGADLVQLNMPELGARAT